MKIRIKQCTGKNVWYAKNIGEEFEVATENAGYYFVDNNPFGITKEDAEVVEEPKQGFSTEFKKDCRNCRFDPNGCNLMGVECDNFSKWQPIEPSMRETADPSKIVTGTEQRNKLEGKSCETCGCEDCHLCNEDHVRWEPIETTRKKFARLEFEKDLPVMNNCDTCQFNVDRPREKCSPCFENNNWVKQDEIVTNNNGGKQSKNEYLWTDFCPKAMLRVAKLSSAGCEKYGKDNWKKISKIDHINHALSHLFLYLAGDKKEDHLAHCAWRVLAVIGVEDE